MKSINPILIDLALLAAILFAVHGLYVVYVHPQSIEVIQAAEAATGVYPARHPLVVIKDLEQEICIVLGLWCLALLAIRYRFTDVDLDLLRADFTGAQEGVAGARALAAKLAEAEAMAPHSILVPAARTALENFQLTDSFDAARNAAFEYCTLQEEVLDSQLTTVKYLLWAIPSIGFLGTVRGIGEALTRANEAMQGDISGIAASLGVAFNSTFVALLISLALTMVSNGLRGREQDRLVKCKAYIAGSFLLQLKRRKAGDADGRPPKQD